MERQIIAIKRVNQLKGKQLQSTNTIKESVNTIKESVNKIKELIYYSNINST